MSEATTPGPMPGKHGFGKPLPSKIGFYRLKISSRIRHSQGYLR